MGSRRHDSPASTCVDAHREAREFGRAECRGLKLARAAGARVIGAARGKQMLGVARELGAEAVFDYFEPSTAPVGQAAFEVIPVIGQTFPLERAAKAHAALEARDVFGKTLLVVGEKVEINPGAPGDQGAAGAEKSGFSGTLRPGAHEN
ncbi:hypothetical protein [Archangium minus]|uniref:hypothetical protein n=1 Tax=Archangium minus TaxID=83450 RepID=UPI0037C04A41